VTTRMMPDTDAASSPRQLEALYPRIEQHAVVSAGWRRPIPDCLAAWQDTWIETESDGLCAGDQSGHDEAAVFTLCELGDAIMRWRSPASCLEERVPAGKA